MRSSAFYLLRSGRGATCICIALSLHPLAPLTPPPVSSPCYSQSHRSNSFGSSIVAKSTLIVTSGATLSSFAALLLVILMDTIDGFVKFFSENEARFTRMKRILEVRCREKLQGIKFFWESRVKDPDSLRQKLVNRQVKSPDKFPDERANVADVRDLVAGRIIYYNWQDLGDIERIITRDFKIKERSELPRSGMKSNE